MSKTLVSVSFCASHWKGADPGTNGIRLPGVQHAEWLEDAVCLYLKEGWSTIVAATDWKGILEVETRPGNEERDVLWRILARSVPIVGTVANPGHQVGAALAIRLGLECAARCGYDFLIHTAEDVLPRPGAVRRMVAALEAGDVYVSEPWGAAGQLNSQFFGVRASVLAGPWDACLVPRYGCIERYLGALLDNQPRMFIPGIYRSTHDREEWLRWREEQKDER